MALAVEGVPVSVCCYMITDDSVEIISVATDPAHQRKGYACNLITHLCETWQEHGVRTAVLMVRQSNQAAQHVFTTCGFTPGVCVRGAYIGNPPEDGMRMQRSL